MPRDSWRLHKVSLTHIHNVYSHNTCARECLQIIFASNSVLIVWLTCWYLLSGQILQKDQEIKDLKQKIAEVMAVMPSISYTADTSSMTPVAPHYSSKFMDTNPSGLDPNASVYQPLKKWTLHLAPPSILLSFLFLQAHLLPICSACLRLTFFFFLLEFFVFSLPGQKDVILWLYLL